MKKNRYRCQLIIMLMALPLCMLFSCRNVKGEELYSSPNQWEYIENENHTITVVRYYGLEESVAIPETIDGKKVTCLGNGKDQVIVSELTEILRIPDAITEISPFSLSYNYVKEFEVSKDHPVFSVIDGIVYDKKMKKLILYPKGRTEVSYKVPDGIEEIGAFAFYNDRMTESIILPDTVKVLGEKAFSLTALSTIRLPSSIEKISNDTFRENRILYYEVDGDNPNYGTINGVLIEKKTRTIISYPGYNNTSEYHIPEGILHIGDYAFSFQDYLYDVSIPDSLESIGEFAFESCDQLFRVNIPANISQIGVGAFFQCPNLSYLTVDENNPVFCLSDEFLINKETSSLIFYIPGCAESEVNIPKEVEKIGAYAFAGNQDIEIINFHAYVTEIGEEAFYNCNSLYSLSFPNNLKMIHEEAFKNCRELKNIHLPNSVIYIGDSAFADTSLEYLKFPESLKYIGDCAFANSLYMEDLEIPENLTHIGKSAFLFNHVEAFIVSPDNPVYAQIDGVLFEKQSKTLLQYPNERYLVRYAVPEGIQVIDESSFAGCTELRFLNIPDTVKTIGAYAFSNCYHLEEVFLSKSVESIGTYAFKGCGQPIFTLEKESYASKWIKTTRYRYEYIDGDDWLLS